MSNAATPKPSNAETQRQRRPQPTAPAFGVSAFRHFAWRDAPRRVLQSRRGASSHGRSYTLIELLLVCAILGIAGTLLIPQIVGRDIMACQAAVRLIIGDLSFAQSDALAHQELRRVHFNADGSGYSISRITQAQLNQAFNAATADYVGDPLSGGEYIVNLAADKRFAGVTIQSIDIDSGQKDLHFDALGGTITSTGTVGTGGSFVVHSAHDSYKIIISAFTGKLTVQRL